MEGLNLRRLVFQYIILFILMSLRISVMYRLEALNVAMDHLQKSEPHGFAELSQEFDNTAAPILTIAPELVPSSVSAAHKTPLTIAPLAKSSVPYCPVPRSFPTYDLEIAILADKFAFKIINIKPCMGAQLSKIGLGHTKCAKDMILSDLNACNNMPCWSKSVAYMQGYPSCKELRQEALDFCAGQAFVEELGPLLVKRTVMEAGFGGVGSYYSGGKVSAKKGEHWIRFGFTDDNGAFFHGSGLYKGAPPYHREVCPVTTSAAYTFPSF